MNLKRNHSVIKKLTGIISVASASTFLGCMAATSLLTQPAFSESSDQPNNRTERYTYPNSTNPNNRVDGTNPIDTVPNRQMNDRSSDMTPNSQMNESTGAEVGGGAGGGADDPKLNNSNMPNRTNTTTPGTTSQPDNRIERYTQPNMGNPSNRVIGPSSTPSGQGGYSAPNSQIDNSTGVGGGAGGGASDPVNNNSNFPNGRLNDGSGSTTQTSPNSTGGSYNNQTSPGSDTYNQSSPSTGGGAGGSGAVPGLW